MVYFLKTGQVNSDFCSLIKFKKMKIPSPKENINTLMCSRIQMKVKVSTFNRAQFWGKNQTSGRDVVTQTLFEIFLQEKFLDEIENANKLNPIYSISKIYLQSSWSIAWVATPQICRTLKLFEIWGMFSNLPPTSIGICYLWLNL